MTSITYCSNCLNPSTRPRISFDDRGWCNACVWSEKKKTEIDWSARWTELERIADEVRSDNGGFDVMVGVSGGKDGSYVAHTLKTRLGLKPLAVTTSVPLPNPVGNQNLENFINSGFDHIKISPNPKILREINKIGFVELGRPLWGWGLNLRVALIRTACAFGIPLIMYGEDGEVEYGGTVQTQNQWYYTIEYAIECYNGGRDPNSLLERFSGRYGKKDLYWWIYPSQEELRAVNPKSTFFSYFENWDPYEHYLVAKEHCGLTESQSASPGTYTNFAQTDTILFPLHMHLAYLKYGFGRCTADVGIDIRRGAMTRKQGIELVKIYDSLLEEDWIPHYLDYYEMTRAEFEETLDRFANPALFRKEGAKRVPLFEVGRTA